MIYGDDSVLLAPKVEGVTCEKSFSETVSGLGDYTTQVQFFYSSCKTDVECYEKCLESFKQRKYDIENVAREDALADCQRALTLATPHPRCEGDCKPYVHKRDCQLVSVSSGAEFLREAGVNYYTCIMSAKARADGEILYGCNMPTFGGSSGEIIPGSGSTE